MPKYLCVGLLVLVGGTVSAEQPFKRMPWHLVDIWWDTGDDKLDPIPKRHATPDKEKSHLKDRAPGPSRMGRT